VGRVEIRDREERAGGRFALVVAGTTAQVENTVVGTESEAVGDVSEHALGRGGTGLGVVLDRAGEGAIAGRRGSEWCSSVGLTLAVGTSVVEDVPPAQRQSSTASRSAISRGSSQTCVPIRFGA
jgi:hypothetical protein